MLFIAGIAAFLIIAFYIMLLVGQIMLICHGFKKDTTWGVCNLLVPFASLVFMFKFWKDEAQPGGKVTLIAIVGIIVCIVIALVAGLTGGIEASGGLENFEANLENFEANLQNAIEEAETAPAETAPAETAPAPAE